LGTRGIPGAHGGFETFAEQLSLFLVARGWRVAVYCQHDVDAVSRRLWIDEWNGVERINVAVTTKGPLGTLDFDWRCTRDAMVRDSVCLVLGYNSAVFLPFLRLKKRRILVNMDGLEWRRQKWSRPVRGWFWVNEWIAAWSAIRMVADHPAIADHLASRRSRSRTVMIPYGGLPVEAANPARLSAFGLVADRYLISIARIEPENNILEIVQAFSLQPRNATLAVLGTMNDANAYHRAVKAAASPQVSFLGPIYDIEILRCLRFNARAYVHGHSAGGTNPSLVEALWAGNAVIAHDNLFNRWTAGAAQFYFKDVAACDAAISAVFGDDDAVARSRVAARLRAREAFNWSDVLTAYERELLAVGHRQADASDFGPAKRDAS
jgi:glycosyltransferase involved in cell wall biosynthesis